jgi:hypothetical protein
MFKSLGHFLEGMPGHYTCWHEVLVKKMTFHSKKIFQVLVKKDDISFPKKYLQV